MALFGGDRDISLFRHINRELINDIIDTQVDIIKHAIRDIKENLYGEALGKQYFQNVRVGCLIEQGSTEIEDTEFGPDVNKTVTFRFLRDDLKDIANLKLEMGDLLKSVANETDAAAANIKFLNFFKKWDETATAQESILKNAANNMSKLQGINYNLNPVKSEAKKIIKELNIYGPAKAPTKTQLKVAEEQGVKLSKTVKLDKPASDELTSLLDDINKLDGTLIRAGGGNKAWSEATDQIFALRKRALELTTHKDKNVRNAGLRLYEKIKNQYSKPKGGTEEFDLA